jgi:hypothetical protein
MGIDISMSVGVGFHVPKDVIDKWIELNDIDDVYESIDVLVRDFKGLTYDYVGNSWVGDEHGYVIWVARVTSSFDMGRSAEAGVYRPQVGDLYPEEYAELAAASLDLTGELPNVETLVTVTVS